MKTLPGILIAFVFTMTLGATTSYSKMYQWTDEQGVVHFTDDSTQIPPRYWERGVVKEKENSKEPANTTRRPMPAVEPLEGKPGEEKPVDSPPETEVRDEDRPEEWWIAQFSKIRGDISRTRDALDQAKSYVSIFEGGRRLGKIFSKEEIEMYERNKREIPDMEKMLSVQESSLAELQKRARIAGVSRKIIE